MAGHPIAPLNPANKGTFTRASKAAGQSVQQHAASVLAPGSNASPLEKRRANFARNAAKWHHGGHRQTVGQAYQRAGKR
jgi:hypothetical protein